MNNTSIRCQNEINTVQKNQLSSALKEIMSATGADGGSLFLFDSQRKELVLNEYHNSNNLFLYGLRQKVGEGVSGRIAGMQKPVLVKNINADSRFRRNGYKHYHTNSFISIPVSGRCGLLGLINLTDKSNGKPFSEEDLKVAYAIAKYAACVADSLNNYIESKEKYASVGKLAAGAIHEINSPLDGIIRYTNMLLEKIEGNPGAKEYVLEVKSGLSRIAGITKSLLQFSRHSDASSADKRLCVDPHQLLDDSLGALSTKLNANITIKKEYGHGLPRILDMGLAHVFTNLIKNALDAMPSGGQLEVSTRLNGMSLEVSFQDTGAGISPELLDRIFEPFFTTKKADKGTGLGLAICQEIISRYGSHINVQSTLGKGTKFTVIIPKTYFENA
ncbi:MAG: GAF domain-containing sensor histidine kinase [Candidatus Omnitrophota bacterium]